jgi:HEPN domain-containing protein
MPDIDHAKMLYSLAESDFRALKGMIDPEIFAEQIFAFHAQQALEKALKAWMSLTDRKYPRIHDLEELLFLLAETGEVVPNEFNELIYLTEYAGQFRYAYDIDTSFDLDREEIISQVEDLMEYIQKRLRQFEG